jgi:hypothetical protein
LVGLGRKLAELLNAIIFVSTTPYLGASIVATELEETGKIGKMEIVDYRDCLEKEAESLLPATSSDQRYVFLTGVLSFDVFELPEITKKFRKAGARVIIGGLLPTIDREVVLQATQADVFIGEAEGAMDLVMEIIQNASPEERFIFHRGLPEGCPDNKYLIQPDNQTGINHVYLNVPPLVDRQDYYSAENERAGRLARRLRHQRMMLPELSFLGKKWDPPSWLLEQVAVSVGCPNNCYFCSTGEIHGNEMRRKPQEALDLWLQAIEGRSILVVDQNFGARSRGESHEDWMAWMKNFFESLRRWNKRFFCQTELAFIERVSRDPELAALVSETLVASLIGLEQPVQVKGALTKDPKNFKKQLILARKMRIVTLGTLVTGIPSNFSVNGEEEISFREWQKWLAALPGPDVLMGLPFIRIRGAIGVPGTPGDSDKPLAGYQGKYEAESLALATEINEWFYRLSSIVRRMGQLRGFSFKRQSVALVLNLGFWMVYAAGLDSRTLKKAMRTY